MAQLLCKKKWVCDMDYYTAENMRDKKVSDLKQDPAFLTDALTFLKSKRKGFTDEDIEKLSADDVVDEVLEHFRMSTTNEVTMAKDYYYVNDDRVDEKERQSYGRLLFTFDNSKGEGMLDRGGEAIFDYAKGVGFAPSTYASIAAGAFTGGAGGAAIQATKQGALMATRKVANRLIGRAALASAVDGSIAAGSQLGLERIKEKSGEEIGEDYETNMGNVVLSGAIGGTVGGLGFAIPQMNRNRVAARLIETADKGRLTNAAALQEAMEKTEATIKGAMSTKEGKKRLQSTTDRLLKAIDPALVKEGMEAKYDILSDTLPDGLVGGLSRDTLRQLSAAAFDLTKKLDIDPESGQRITEVLANRIDTDADDIFTAVAEKYNLSKRQLSAVYAAEVSEAAKILADQSKLVRKGGANVTGAVDGKKFAEDIERLYNSGMSSIDPSEAKRVLDSSAEAGHGIAGGTWRTFKEIESARRALMTSQVATTMRNNIFGVAMGFIDTVDQFNTGVAQILRGKGRQGISTMAGSFDTLRYLTSDNVVAEALIKTVQQDSPETLSRVFQNAAMAESSLVSNSVLARMGKAFNVLNTISDHTFKKAVIASSINRQLRAQGSNIMEEMAAGRLSNISTEMLTEAMDESLMFTFQGKFGGKGASAESKATQAVVDGINKFGLTVLIPFPRYLASQAKFISDYTGLTLIRRMGTGRSIADKEFGKAATGAAAFGALYQVQKENIANNLEWFHGQTDDGQTYNAQAALGPGAFHAYMANTAARVMGGHEVKGNAAIKKDIAKIAIGTEFRPSGTIVDKTIRAVESGDMKPFWDAVGDYLGAFTYPAAVVKDFYGQFDPRASYFPETRDATVNILDLGLFEVPLSSIQRITRQLPDFNARTIAKTAKEITGFDMDPKKAEGLLKFFNTSTRATFQTKFKGNEDEGYDAVRMDIFGEGPLRVTNPAIKQVIGLVGEPRMNVLKREFVRLQVDAFSVYNPYREKNAVVSVLAEQMLQGNLLDHMKKMIESPAYKNLSTEEQKLVFVGGNDFSKKFSDAYGFSGIGIKDYIAKTRAFAKEQLAKMADPNNAEFNGDYINYTRGRLTALPRREVESRDAMFARYSEGTRWAGKTLKENIEDINSLPDDQMDRDEKDILITNLINKYLIME